MIKRIFSIILVVFTALSSGLVASSYSENLYYIDLPDTFSEQKSNQFVDKDGNTIIVHISPRHKLQEEIPKGIESIYDLGDSITSMLPSDESVNAEFGNFDKYEITTFTKNDYKCLHVKFSAVINNVPKYMDVYRTYTNNSIFNIFISSSDETFAESESIKNTLNSFTIKNNQATDSLDESEILVPKLLQRNATFYKNIMKIYIISIIARAIISILTVAIVLLIVKSRNNRNNQK